MNLFDANFFDTIHERQSPLDIKYNAVPKEKAVIPMWIADMDFQSPPCVLQALESAVKSGIFGYTKPDEEYNELVINWYKKRMNWQFESDCILKAPGVIFAVAASILALSKKDDSVLICQPVYFPFAKIITDNSRKLVVSELQLKDGKYEIDFEDFENKIRQNNVKIFLLCSPHNPVGRVWTKEELLEIGRICCKHNVYIISDEIHSDFVFESNRHIPIASLSPEISDRTITCTSPTKTFNFVGLQAANIIITNPIIRREVHRACRRTGYGNINTLATVATKAAYKNGEPWLESLLSYLQSNARLLKEAGLKSNGKLSLIEPEGTYLMWLDCRKLEIPNSRLDAFFVEEAGVKLHNGSIFGLGGSGFMRMNIACPKDTLNQALSQIQKAINK